MHKHDYFLANNNSFNKKMDYKQIVWEAWMLHVYSHKNFIFDVRIIKFHRMMILQQTPSSDTPTSGTHPLHLFFSTWYVGRLLVNKIKSNRYSYCLLLHHCLLHDWNFAYEVLLACNKLRWGWQYSCVKFEFEPGKKRS